jgi:hypothetical protein
MQFAVLLELAENGFADVVTISSVLPGANARDLETALMALVAEGLVEPTTTLTLDSVARLAAVGGLALTDKGRHQIHEV